VAEDEEEEEEEEKEEEEEEEKDEMVWSLRKELFCIVPEKGRD
jgi:hypothetical protein